MRKQYTLKGGFRTAGELMGALSSITRESPSAEVKVYTTFGGFIKEIRVTVDEPSRNNPELS